MTATPGGTEHSVFVLFRCRLGVRLAPGDLTAEFEATIADEVVAAAAELGALVELLQLAVAVDPSWALAGPPNRCGSPAK